MSFKGLKKIKIVIVAGGWSSERLVSINSGKNVFNTLKKNGYKVTFFDLKKYGALFVKIKLQRILVKVKLF